MFNRRMMLSAAVVVGAVVTAMLPTSASAQCGPYGCGYAYAPAPGPYYGYGYGPGYYGHRHWHHWR